MTQEQILERLTRTASDTFQIAVFSPFLDKNITIEIFSGASDNNTIVITESIVNAIMTYDGAADRQQILNTIYADYKNAIKVTDYAMVPFELVQKHNDNYEAANQEYFNINSPEEAYNALTFEYAYITQYAGDSPDATDARFLLVFDRPWDNEHALMLFFQNQTFVSIE